MDLKTENQIAKILMKEAAELRRQAEIEGVHAYIRKPNVRFRPNSRFLTTTVLGVQQANRAADINEMWRVRRKEQEVNDELSGASKDKNCNVSTSVEQREGSESCRSTGSRYRKQSRHIPSSSKADFDESCTSTDGGWKEEEVEAFLHARVKRGRGGVGPRMDEPGPYLPRSGPDSRSKLSESRGVKEKEKWEEHGILGPEKSLSLRSNRSSRDDVDEGSWKKAKKVMVEDSEKHSKKLARREDKHVNKERKQKF